MVHSIVSSAGDLVSTAERGAGAPAVTFVAVSREAPAGSVRARHTGAAGAAGPLASWLGGVARERSWAPVAVMTPNVAPGASVYSRFM